MSVLIENQILFFFAGLGVFNGLLLVVYLLFGLRPQKTANILLALLFLMLCIRIGKSVFLVFAEVSRTGRQIGLSACMLIGPFLYLYLKRLLFEEKKWTLVDQLHIVIPTLLVVTFGFIWPYESNYELWNEYVVQVFYVVWIAYMLGTAILLKNLFLKRNKKQMHLKEKWGMLLYVCV